MSAPLAVESLGQRLHRLVPNALVVDALERFKDLKHRRWCMSKTLSASECNCDKREFLPASGERFNVVRDGRVLAVGPSEREAVSRAVFLYGSGR